MRDRLSMDGVLLAVEDHITIRLARPEDCPAITAIAFRSKASNGYDTEFMEACREELTYTAKTLTEGEIWLAEEGNSILGFIGLALKDNYIEIAGMFVEPAKKGRSVGRMLWQQMETRAGILGFSTIRLDADPTAVGFYQAMGMQIEGQSPSGSITGRFLPRMAKRLNSRANST